MANVNNPRQLGIFDETSYHSMELNDFRSPLQTVGRVRPDDFHHRNRRNPYPEEFVAEAFSCVGLSRQVHLASAEILLRPSEIMTSSEYPKKARIRANG